ncbi:MAG: RDD family protein [Actinomycetota bacterium]|nr:RDD family protein [Actinomycetota bacterium]
MSDQPPAQPAGWYHAQGDPPNTQRYWDGTQWQGGPQAVEQPGSGIGSGGFAGATGAPAYGSTGERFVAYLIDIAIVIPAVVIHMIVAGIAGAISAGLGFLVALLLPLAIFAVVIYNFVYLQGTTGQTFGTSKQGIKLVSIQTGQPLGIGGTIIRYIVGAIFAIPFYLDHFWILFDQNNQRLSDNTLGNHVIEANR